MKRNVLLISVFATALVVILYLYVFMKPVTVMVVTGGHKYQEEPFNEMLTSLGSRYRFEVVSFPEAHSLFLPENRHTYDVLLFYHMWREIAANEEDNLSECIKEGKPLVVLHHSICAFDDWPEYTDIIGGKYFHNPTVINGVDYPASGYIHDLKFNVKVVDSHHPVTKGVPDFDILDETYSGFYVDPQSKPLLTTDEPSSTEVIAWTKKYGKSQVVTIQSGHDANAYGNPHYRKLLKQAIGYALKKSE